MKIRSGFVSNSSSSSYVIKLNGPVEACPTCGHKPENIVDIIRNSCGDHETSIAWDNVDEYIERLANELEDECNYLAELQARDPNEPLYRSAPTSRTVKDGIPSVEGRITDLRERLKYIEELKAEDARLVGIEISYHDEYVQHVLDDCVERGTITIVEDWS